MDSQVMMALGDFRFSISTAAYESIERTREWKWGVVDRIGQKPARQFTGPGDDTITLQGVIYPHFIAQRRGLEQVSRMAEEASKGEALLMVDGRGRVWGDYVILSIRETHSFFFSDNTPRKIEFSVELAAYEKDRIPSAAGRT